MNLTTLWGRWQNGAILPYSLLVTYTLWSLRIIFWYTALAVPFESCFLSSNELYTHIITIDMFFDVIFCACVLILLFTVRTSGPGILR